MLLHCTFSEHTDPKQRLKTKPCGNASDSSPFILRTESRAQDIKVFDEIRSTIPLFIPKL